jgi:Flp pilus assembly protein TadD
MDGRTILAAMLAIGLSLSCSAGAWAQPASPRAQARPPADITLARRQIAAGQLTQALATLEQAILARPADGAPRLLHASVLCRLDDPSGARVEFDQLRGWDFPPDLWREATDPCEAAREGGDR